jgi:NAD(P)-dependent dehydrogenase (short-subunit alcohol dehydrogenase family)
VPGANLDRNETPSGALPTPDVPKAALVTGGGQRIGRALCLSLAEAGFAVAVHHLRSGKAAEVVAAAIRDKGGKAAALAADLNDEVALTNLLPRAAAALGPIGVLVNNASVFEGDTVDTATRGSWERHLSVNLRAPFVLTQEFARHLPADHGGVIVNLLDERVWSLTPYFVSYTVTKAGLWTLTQTMALALAPRIRVNGIGPGPTLPSPRHRRGVALHPRCAGDDRPDDRLGWRPASRLGAAATGQRGRIGNCV